MNQQKQATDLRLLNLSYSGLLTLHSCPRRFQLSRLNAEKARESDESSLTFAFGHTVGLGVQLHFEGRSLDSILWELFLGWEADLLASNPKQKKSFWLAIAAIQNLEALRSNGFLEDWELVYYQGLPAVELSFSVDLLAGYSYRGFVDAVLQHKETKKVMILEVKTDSSTSLSPAKYKNSAQAIGYSVVLDHMFPELSSYEVLYLVYLTKNQAYESLEFGKSYLQRALWLQELLLDVETLKLYEAEDIYPMRGESCFNYFRECEYIQTCTLKTDYLVCDLNEEELAALKEKESKYQIKVTLSDLVQSQINKGY